VATELGPSTNTSVARKLGLIFLHNHRSQLASIFALMNQSNSMALLFADWPFSSALVISSN
jgi:hypothetical protein